MHKLCALCPQRQKSRMLEWDSRLCFPMHLCSKSWPMLSGRAWLALKLLEPCNEVVCNRNLLQLGLPQTLHPQQNLTDEEADYLIRRWPRCRSCEICAGGLIGWLRRRRAVQLESQPQCSLSSSRIHRLRAQTSDLQQRMKPRTGVPGPLPLGSALWRLDATPTGCSRCWRPWRRPAKRPRK